MKNSSSRFYWLWKGCLCAVESPAISSIVRYLPWVSYVRWAYPVVSFHWREVRSGSLSSNNTSVVDMPRFGSCWHWFGVLGCVVCCVFSSHSFWTSSSLDVPAGVTQEEGHTHDFSSTVFLRCVPYFFSREGFSHHSFPSSTVKSNFVY